MTAEAKAATWLIFNATTNKRPHRFLVMRTQVMRQPAIGYPWLECDPECNGSVKRIDLESLPFSIGRGESMDYCIDSGRVSREHAVIAHDGDRYLVRDLGSTNGTFVNGHRVDGEADLHDGDILIIADAELSFFCGRSGAHWSQPTQIMDPFDQACGCKEIHGWDIIHQVRILQETLTYRAVDVRLDPIVDLEDQSVLGYEANHGQAQGEGEPERARPMVLAADWHWAVRLRELKRLLAAEEFSVKGHSGQLFLKIDVSELGDESLVESFARAQATLPGASRLVAEIPDSAICDTPYARELRARLRAMGIGIAYDGFAAGQVELAVAEELRPDYLKLAPFLVRGMQNSGQRRDQVSRLVETARRLGCRAVAVGSNRQ